MTEDGGSVETEDELTDALREILMRAHRAGLDVEGGWECRNGDAYPDWDVVVAEVEKVDRPHD